MTIFASNKQWKCIIISNLALFWLKLNKMCKFFNSYEESLHWGVCKLAKYVRNCVVLWKNLHSWQKIYTTAGRDGHDKFQVCRMVEWNKLCNLAAPPLQWQSRITFRNIRSVFKKVESELCLVHKSSNLVILWHQSFLSLLKKKEMVVNKYWTIT